MTGDAGVVAAAAALRAGRLVGLPTETVYGLGADAFQPLAVARIFEAKRRPSFDPLIVHLPDVDEVSRVLAEPLGDAGLLLAQHFWPGPLTLVAPKSSRVPDIVTSGLDTVAVRVPDHPVARAVLVAAGCPVAAPSANRFGYVSPTTAAHVAEQLGEDVDVIVDAGACRIGVESTIVSVAGDAPVVLRFGGVSVEQLEAVVGPIARRLHSSDRPEAPGQLSRHYATRTPIRLVVASATTPSPDRVLVVTSGRAGAESVGYGRVEELSPAGDLAQAAHRLFAVMRALDGASFAGIDVIPCPEIGLGRAIVDRLRRAAVRHESHDSNP